MVASKNVLASPATPEQDHIAKPRTYDGENYTPDDGTPMIASTMTTTTPATVDITTSNWSDSDPVRMLDVEYHQNPLASTHQEGAPGDAATAATHLETAALEKIITNLRRELAHQSFEYTNKLDAEHAWCQSTIQQASDVACSLRDANVQLTAEVEQLRSRVGQLELEAGEQSAAMYRAVYDDEQLGNEQLIAALQVEIGDLQRQLHRAHRARVAAAETEEAALQRAEILQQQVEQMVNLLETERIEKEKQIEALKAANVLPSALKNEGRTLCEN